jgi:hypothetical protein
VSVGLFVFVFVSRKVCVLSVLSGVEREAVCRQGVDEEAVSGGLEAEVR